MTYAGTAGRHCRRAPHTGPICGDAEGSFLIPIPSPTGIPGVPSRTWAAGDADGRTVGSGSGFGWGSGSGLGGGAGGSDGGGAGRVGSSVRTGGSGLGLAGRPGCGRTPFVDTGDGAPVDELALGEAPLAFPSRPRL